MVGVGCGLSALLSTLVVEAAGENGVGSVANRSFILIILSFSPILTPFLSYLAPECLVSFGNVVGVAFGHDFTILN